jgi:hypothetical protein
MARLRLRLFVVSFLCACGSVSFAQNTSSPPNVDPSTGASSRTVVNKSPHKKPSTAARLTVQPPNEEAEKSARLAEGRKKFFEQSSGFENNDSSSPFSLGSKGSPAMGLKF